MNPTRCTCVVAVAAVAAVAASSGLGQPAETKSAEDPWSALRFFVGSWEGTGEGRWGTSTIRRTYEFVLNDSFLFARNHSSYPPQEKNTKGEEHEDWSFFSYDKSRGSFVLREFHNESIVNRYTLDEIADDGQRLVFITEHIENFIPGWRARQTYRIVGPDAFEEVFELAKPEGEYNLFITNRFTRTK